MSAFSAYSPPVLERVAIFVVVVVVVSSSFMQDRMKRARHQLRFKSLYNGDINEEKEKETEKERERNCLI